MSDEKKPTNTVDDLATALGVVVAAVQGAIKIGGALVEFADGGEITDHTPAEVITNITSTAMKVHSNLDAVYTSTGDAIKKLKNLDPKDVAESAKGAIASLTNDLEGEARAALDSVAQTVNATVAGANLPTMTDLVGMTDACDSGLAFGYQPAAEVLEKVKDIVGVDSDLGKWLQEMDGTFKSIGEAVPFINMAIQLANFGIDQIAAVNDQLIKDTDAWMERATIERKNRRDKKPELKRGSLIRIDGLLYGGSEDARIRNDVLRNTQKSKSPARMKMADQYTRLVNKHLETKDGEGKLFTLVDGDRAFEHAKDMMLLSLLRAGQVPISEVQQLGPDPVSFSMSMRGTNTKLVDDAALAYAKTAPGAALWIHWNDLARQRPLLYSRRIVRVPRSLVRMGVKDFIVKHPVATAAAAGATLSGVLSLVTKR